MSKFITLTILMTIFAFLLLSSECFLYFYFFSAFPPTSWTVIASVCNWPLVSYVCYLTLKTK